MIGVLTALTLALPQAGAPLMPCGLDLEAGLSEGRTGASELLEQLRRLSCARQQPGARDSWEQVEAVMESLLLELQSQPPGQHSFPQGLARLVVDLSLGATVEQRLNLVRSCEDLLSLDLDVEQAQQLLGAQVSVLEPIVANAGAEASLAPLARRALALYEGVAEAVTDPVTGEAPSFMRRSRLRLERLRLGAPMPRFVARDTAGNELRSAQLEGGVLVLRFWDPSSPASLAAHRADSALVRDYWDAPFDLLGVTRSEDRGAYLRFIESARFGGVQLFDGPISSTLAEALDGTSWGGLGAVGSTSGPGPKQSLSNRWGSPPPGSLFVVDATGRIRGRDLPPAQTRALVDELIEEEQRRRRQQFLQGARTR